jgi:hypothetical protein
MNGPTSQQEYQPHNPVAHPEPEAQESIQLLSGFLPILVLFLFLRLTVLALYTPQGLINVYTDYDFYYRTVQLSDEGYFPYINMWYEYPPLLAYIPQFSYEITQNILPAELMNNFGYAFFIRILGSILLLFDAGVLVLLYRIGVKVWGNATAAWLSWVYLSLSLPMFFWNYSHQVAPTFFLLLAMDLFLSRRTISSALALGLGIAAKLTPLFFLAVVLKFLWPDWKRILLYGLASLLVFGLFFLPFIGLGKLDWTIASFKAWANVGSWRTVWALIDGNDGPGYYGPLETRTQIQEAAVLRANPPVIPIWLSTLAFAGAYLWLLVKPIDKNLPKNLVYLTLIAALFFHLWSKGWSPQWMVLLIPIFLLSFPGKLGLIIVLGLSALTFIEWPLLDLIDSNRLYAVQISLRTISFLAILFLAIKKIWNPVNPTLAQDTIQV